MVPEECVSVHIYVIIYDAHRKNQHFGLAEGSGKQSLHVADIFRTGDLGCDFQPVEEAGNLGFEELFAKY